MKINEFKKFELDSLEKVNGGYFSEETKTIIVSNCGSEDEDAEDDKDKEENIQ